MPRPCDHTNVGIVVHNPQGEIAVIKRKNLAVAYALPARHCGGDSYENAAIREAREKIGIVVFAQKKIWQGIFQNPCCRDADTFHRWEIFEAGEWAGMPAAGSDARELIWLPKVRIEALAYRTWGIINRLCLGMPSLSHADLVSLLAFDQEWQEDPGLELIWCILLTRLGVIRIKPIV